MIKAKYTVVLKTLLDDDNVRPLIHNAMSKYPLYQKKSEEKWIPSYIPTRDELNNKILNHYKYREIGTETIGGFLDRLETTMNEIMPKYNLLYLTADQDFNIIYNVDYIKTIDTDRDGSNSNTVNGTNANTMSGTTSNTTEGSDTTTNTSSSNGSNSSEVNDTTSTSATVNNYNKHVESSTPQGLLNISNTGIDSVSYADKATWNHDTNSDTGSSTGTSTTESTSSLSGTNNTSSENEVTSNGTTSQTSNTTATETQNGEKSETEKIVEKTLGNFGVVSAQDLILKYREMILNIDKMIIEDTEISDLFMTIY